MVDHGVVVLLPVVPYLVFFTVVWSIIARGARPGLPPVWGYPRCA